ncbi:hypothetical protein FACS1894211_14970 [Clostridia bacterium]|nr:hypothetical protein FACS1894211_14970 [Clostridia bacterium]
MKKKIIPFIAIALCMALLLSGCEGLFGKPETKIYNLNYSTDEDYLVGLTDSVIGSCVEVYGSSATGSASGSGVIIHTDKDKNETYILTNSHVITAKNGLKTIPDTVFGKIEICFFGSSTPYRAEIVNNARSASSDKTTDLALLKVGYYSESHGPVRVYSGALKYAQHILAIGNGQNLGTSVCDGLVSNPSITFNAKDGGLTCELIQISAGVNPGNSGGALFDMKGYLIGINTLKLVANTANDGNGESNVNIFADNISFSLPVSNLQRFMSDNGKSDLLNVVAS